MNEEKIDRKISVIFATDVVDYSLHMEKDETGTVTSLRKYEKFLKENGCKIIEVENWGLKKLAYSIQKKLSGFYALIDFEYDSEVNVIELYETELKRDERIMRYLNVSLDKDANNWAVKRRKKLKKDKA